MKNQSLFSESHSATYCPEDNKLRLYVGRVPRDEYEALRADGWTSTPKQDCDFVAHWTPSRRDTCLFYAGTIDDEDTPPQERAADRAERFNGYLDKRSEEAAGFADQYESGPSAHGYQSERKAEKAAARHDRLGDKAGDQWSKAEYWQRRTAGVISHALYKSDPCVRMGRIKILEAEQRKNEESHKEYAQKYARVTKWLENVPELVEAIAKRYHGGADAENIAKAEETVCDEVMGYGKHRNPASPDSPPAYRFEHLKSEHPPTVEDYLRYWLKTHAAPDVTERPWAVHYELRLAYERQMLEAQGGRAGALDMVPGGWLTFKRRNQEAKEYQIQKVNKSSVSGRVTSVEVLAMRDIRYNNETREYERALCSVQVDVERSSPDEYRAPTPEELEDFNAKVKAAKAAKKAAAPAAIPLINPTDEDAQRLQTLINERHAAEWKRHHGTPTQHYFPKTAEVERITQAVYSANSSGSYAKAETRTLHADGVIADRESNMWSSAAEARRKARGPALCKIRIAGYDPIRVLIISDKPQKALPAAVWTAAKTELVTA